MRPRTHDSPGAADSGVSLREVDTRDREAAHALHDRCSRRTLTQRYHGSPPDADRYLEHLLSPRFGRSLAAYSAGGQMVGLGHLLWDGADAEVALLVADRWQGRGVGTRLLRGLCELARREGHECVYALAPSSNSAVAALMHGLRTPVTRHVQQGGLVIEARLTPLPSARPARLACGPTLGH
ncbi:GNAT family N-acetyltransferase [Streptomyces oceani]|uniref:GNAT family N-acetyltransferase n=1 Tax=Streptomyces oceani TaxID=1075402 RepID=UPI00147A08E8|nr:GNAT family N-acetyltransferase [Streptomyces oceani]